MGKSWINAQQPNTGSVNFKNKIINGDFSVNQRKDPVIDNEEDYPIDRVCVYTANSSVYSTTEDIYSLNEGSMYDSKDPFSDSSLNNKYLFDSNSNDLLGNNNGSDTNVDYVAGGKYGNCLFTDQDHTSHVELDSIPKIFDETDKTFSCWVSNLKSANKFALITSAIDSNKNDNRAIFMKFAIQVSGGPNINFSQYPDDDYLHHYCFTVGSNGTKVYIDGKLVASDTRTIINNSGTASYDAYAVGNYWSNIADSSGNAPNIKIDQIEIFTRALTEDEVKKLYVESLNYIQKKHYKSVVLTKDSNANINPYIYKFEGQHISDLIKDDMTLSFELFSNISGSYNVKLVTECLDGTQETFSTTINHSGSDFERFEITIPNGTLTKDIVNDERLGATLYIANNADSNLNVNDWIRLANVQLEKGNVATEFEQLPYEVQLDRCLRYYEENYYSMKVGQSNSSTDVRGQISYRKKRINPSIKGKELNFFNDNSTTVSITSIAFSHINKRNCRYDATVDSDALNDNTICYGDFGVEIDTEL